MKCSVIIISLVVAFCEAQHSPSIPLSQTSFRPIARAFTLTPPGRVPVVEDIIIRQYHTNVTSPTSRRIGNIKQILKDPQFDVGRPTVLYAHGYAEMYTDDSVKTVMSAYLRRGGYNVLLLDWANIGFGNYVVDVKMLPLAGVYVGQALLKVVNQGLPIDGMHLVGHSMGSHLAAYIGRYLAKSGYTVPRLTGLDPAYPGYYPPILASHMAATDAAFVDVIHTDSGYYGTPTSTGKADFWPNGGKPKQPGCISPSIPFTTEDFCSHWRSWEFWAESLNTDSFLARRCDDYDSFLKGECEAESAVFMGIRATPNLRGNYYLRTAAKAPFGLGIRGAS